MNRESSFETLDGYEDLEYGDFSNYSKHLARADPTSTPKADMELTELIEKVNLMSGTVTKDRVDFKNMGDTVIVLHESLKKLQEQHNVFSNVQQVRQTKFSERLEEIQKEQRRTYELLKKEFKHDMEAQIQKSVQTHIGKISRHIREVSEANKGLTREVEDKNVMLAGYVSDYETGLADSRRQQDRAVWAAATGAVHFVKCPDCSKSVELTKAKYHAH